MLLKRLEIKGFKTFADTTEISLKPGINVIVGPNGCGKSNIVDAIRWVLGESNIRNLRGEKNEDVIFNGSDKKRPLSMATVQLTIDNAENSLPIDYTEVTMGRKVFRSGESEFAINKSKVRLKDMSNLFAGTGLGKKGYSIISQGELEQVLNGQGFDRRLILEEASGIIKYRYQRDEAQKRIMSTQNDIIRVSDILQELEARKEDLGQKAEKAKTYIELSEKHQQLEKKFLSHQIKNSKETLKEKKESLLVIENTIKSKYDILQEHQEMLLNMEKDLEEKRKSFNKAKEKKHELENMINNCKADINLSNERLNNSCERQNNAEEEKTKYSVLIEKVALDLESAENDYSTEEQKYFNLKSKLDNLTEEIKDLEIKINNKNDKFEYEKNQVFDILNKETEIKNKITKSEEEAKRLNDKKQRLKKNIYDLEEKQKNLLESQENIKSKIKVEDQKREKVNQNIIKLKSSRDEIVAELNIVKDTEQDLNSQNNRLNTKLLTLQDMDKNFVGYSEGVKAIIKAKNKKEIIGLIDVIGNLIDVPNGLELAVETVAGRSLENVVAQDSNAAKQAIKFLKANNSGRVTFLPLDNLRVRPLPNEAIKKLMSYPKVIGLGSTLIKHKASYAKAIQYLFGRVLFVEDINTGMDIFKNTNYAVKIVSKEGDLITVSGALTGGNHKKSKVSPFQRKKEQKEINELMTKCKAQIETNNSKKQELLSRLSEIDEELTNTKNSINEIDFLLEIKNNEKLKLKQDINNIVQDKQVKLQELKSTQNNINHITKIIDELKDEYKIRINESQGLTEHIEELKQEINDYKSNYEIIKERKLSLAEQIEMKSKELSILQKNITQYKELKSSYKQSIEKANETYTKSTDEINKQMVKINKHNKELKEYHEHLKQYTAYIEKQEQNIKNIYKTVNDKKEEIDPLNKEIKYYENQKQNIKIKVAKLENELEYLTNNWENKFKNDIPIQDGLNAKEIKEYSLLLKNLEIELENLGLVDVAAIDEYKELIERYDFLIKQYNDLNNAKDSLKNLLKENEKLMNNSFKHFLKQANESFRQTFIEIFNGGDASLNIDLNENLLEAGIDIVVKMPGKRNQPLNLLSGGERALTCIAFIFSLLRLKPAPFCLLDEIDSALDETNLLRFSNFLQKMSTTIQFIVITHRQATIEAGKMIYGITMPEEGVSSVYSLDISSAQDIAG
ncbi:Chromosome partition protein smc [Candidatus Syntrophocurvum alkaliphilum]|uniref:Chromosome partition protein Smc n=1 Tax=Candidatus Syntrophocurvum alkaliphilum TaxID=2293317 RepID=A0A6I6DF62_9FIRM|nr:chromosome segregation protein SMC [Candidatus Syntrophocurvum alkaliphilum]QGT99091.1 Chromosome partition protein smc [Candidatus Syntrophocurvum alkaliphilum]